MAFKLSKSVREKLHDPQMDALCRSNLAAFCMTYLGQSAFNDAFNSFSHPFSPRVHGELLDALDDFSVDRLCIQAARDTGKSTLMKGYTIWCLCYGHRKFVYYISKKESIAVNYSRSIITNLSRNPYILERFGQVCSPKAGLHQFYTKTGYCFMTSGMEQQNISIQSGSAAGGRPDQLIADDIQKTINVKNEDTRNRDYEIFMTDVINCVSGNARVFVIQNAIHPDTICNRLRTLKGWRYIHIPICDHNVTTSYWPEEHKIEKLRTEYENHKKDGRLHIFYNQRLADPSIPPEEQAIQEHHLLTYACSDKVIDRTPGIQSFVLCDPAKTDNMASAHSAVLGISIDRSQNKIYVREAVDGKWKPDQVIDKIFEIAEKINAYALAPEITGLEDWLKSRIREKQNETRTMYSLFWMKANNKAKEDRFKQVVPYFQKGNIYVKPSLRNMLIPHLVHRGAGRLDLGDCFGHIPELLRRNGIFFEAKNREIDEAQHRMERDRAFIQNCFDSYETLKIPNNMIMPVVEDPFGLAGGLF